MIHWVCPFLLGFSTSLWFRLAPGGLKLSSERSFNCRPFTDVDLFLLSFARARRSRVPKRSFNLAHNCAPFTDVQPLHNCAPFTDVQLQNWSTVKLPSSLKHYYWLRTARALLTYRTVERVVVTVHFFCLTSRCSLNDQYNWSSFHPLAAWAYQRKVWWTE
jgi:hypothetical protein